MRNRLFTILLISLAACSVLPPEPTITSTVSPIPTSTLVTTSTITPTNTPEPTATPLTYTLTFLAFHDYNGNGIMDEGEPAIEGILNKLPVGECTTRTDGRCELLSVPSGKNEVTITDIREVENSKKMRYILLSLSEVIIMAQGLDIDVSSDGMIIEPLANGFLTLPFYRERNNKFEMFSFVDLDPRPNLYVRNFEGSTKVAQGSPLGTHVNGTAPNHDGIDWIVLEGKSVIAAAPGKVISVGNITGCEGALGVEIKHFGGVVTLYDHLSQILVKTNDNINRGDLIGLTGNTGKCSGGPHLHFGLLNSQNQVVDPYRDEVDPAGSRGYWTVDNNPQFYR